MIADPANTLPRPLGPESCPRARAAGQDPHELRHRLRADLRPRVRQVVLHGRVRQAQAVGGRLLRPGDEDRGDHSDLTVGRALGGAAGRPMRHALRPNSSGVGGSARRIVIERSLVAGLSLAPRPVLRSSALNSPVMRLPARRLRFEARDEPDLVSALDAVDR